MAEEEKEKKVVPEASKDKPTVKAKDVPKVKKGKSKVEKEKCRIAVVRVRGSVHMKPQIKKTFELLKLKEPNHCVLLDNTAVYKGMINKINDYVTWGEVSLNTVEGLLTKRGKVIGGNLDDAYVKKNSEFQSIKDLAKAFMDFKVELNTLEGFKKPFRLNPPRKGFERFGIKKAYSIGGALGYRKEKINELIERML